MKNTMYFLVGIIGVLSLIGTVTTSYSEIDSDMFDDLDIEPESLDYFTERGFEIYTLPDKYGYYFIPYKMNGFFNSVLIDESGLFFSVSLTKHGDIDFIIPSFLFTRSHDEQVNDEFIILSNNEEKDFKQKKMGNLYHFNLEIKDDSQEFVVIGSPHVYVKKYADPFITPEQKTINTIYFDIHPPLKQTQNDVTTQDILCKESLVLILYPNGSPACVKSESIPKLIERGWVKTS